MLNGVFFLHQIIQQVPPSQDKFLHIGGAADGIHMTAFVQMDGEMVLQGHFVLGIQNFTIPDPPQDDGLFFLCGIDVFSQQLFV